MAEGVLGELKATPMEIKKSPWTALAIGFIFLTLVLLLEAYKPGVITNPIKSFLAMFGVGTAPA